MGLNTQPPPAVQNALDQLRKFRVPFDQSCSRGRRARNRTTYRRIPNSTPCPVLFTDPATVPVKSYKHVRTYTASIVYQNERRRMLCQPSPTLLLDKKERQKLVKVQQIEGYMHKPKQPREKATPKVGARHANRKSILRTASRALQRDQPHHAGGGLFEFEFIPERRCVREEDQTTPAMGWLKLPPSVSFWREAGQTTPIMGWLNLSQKIRPNDNWFR